MSQTEVQQELGVPAQETAPTEEQTEKRKEPRFPSDLSAILTILEIGKVLEARTVDVSRSGLRVRSPEPVNVGERLRIQFSGTIAFGEARWCRDVKGTGHDIGILVEHSLSQSLVDSVHAALKRVQNGK